MRLKFVLTGQASSEDQHDCRLSGCDAQGTGSRAREAAAPATASGLASREILVLRLCPCVHDCTSHGRRRWLVHLLLL